MSLAFKNDDVTVKQVLMVTRKCHYSKEPSTHPPLCLNLFWYWHADCIKSLIPAKSDGDAKYILLIRWFQICYGVLDWWIVILFLVMMHLTISSMQRILREVIILLVNPLNRMSDCENWKWEEFPSVAKNGSVKPFLTPVDGCVSTPFSACMHAQTDSACILVLDKQKWQRAGLTRFGVNMTALEMTENNCQNEGEIVPAWDRQRESGCAVTATGPASVPLWCFCAGLFLRWGLTSPACFWTVMVCLQLQNFSRKICVFLFLFELHSVGWCAESDTIRLLWHQRLHAFSSWLLILRGGHMSTDSKTIVWKIVLVWYSVCSDL